MRRRSFLAGFFSLPLLRRLGAVEAAPRSEAIGPSPLDLDSMERHVQEHRRYYQAFLSGQPWNVEAVYTFVIERKDGE